jgi:hypothetical protein
MTYYSQFHEDAIADGLFRKIGTTNKICCDIGAADGKTCSNTRFFMENGWDGAFIEPHPGRHRKLAEMYSEDKCVQKAVDSDVTIDGILERISFPLHFDLISIDIDGQDYYVWRDMVKYRPRMVIIEWSPHVDCNYIPERNTDGDGGKNQAGLVSMLRLAHEKEYYVAAITPVNLICVEGRLINQWKRYWDGRFPL